MKPFLLLSAFLLIFGSLIIAGCSSTSPVEEEEEGGPDATVPIAFQSRMSRAVVDADLTGLQPFSVWGWYTPTTGGTGTPLPVFDATTVQTDGSYSGLRYWMPGHTYHFYALHPAGLASPASGTTQATAQSVACTSDGTFTVTGFDASLHRGADAVDLMTACPAACDGSNPPVPVPLAFSHELAWVSFQVAADQPVTIEFVRLMGIAYKGDWNSRGTPAWTGTVASDATSGAPFHQETPFAIDQTQVQGHTFIDLLGGHLLLPPQELTEKGYFHMKWTYTGLPEEPFREVKVSLHRVGITTWEKGKHYVYAATIPPTPVDVQLTVKVKDWVDQKIETVL